MLHTNREIMIIAIYATIVLFIGYALHINNNYITNYMADAQESGSKFKVYALYGMTFVYYLAIMFIGLYLLSYVSNCIRL